MAYYKDLSYIRSNGKRIKKGYIIKSSNLSKLDVSKLKVKKIIDLRTKEEVSNMPDIIPDGVKYINIPMLDNRMTGITHEKTSRLKQLESLSSMSEVYREIVSNEDYVNNISKILKEIINADEYPIIYHCSEGKDRTGIITYLILYILGFEEKEIIKDYLYINKYNMIKSYIYYLIVLIMKQDLSMAEKARKFKIADQNYLYRAIKTIKEKYGTIEEYLKNGLSISPNEQRKFKTKLLIIENLDK